MTASVGRRDVSRGVDEGPVWRKARPGGDPRELPRWAREEIPRWGDRVWVPEWDDDETFDDVYEICDGGVDAEEKKDGVGETSDDGDYRSSNGWKGSDLCHASTSPVRISHYRVRYPADSAAGGGVGTILTGLAHFTPRAESHAGHCHGGSMTSVMDDVIGWTAFVVSGECRPWSGFTAQVNVTLRKPITVGSYLKIEGRVTRCDGRKVWIAARLVAVGGDDGGEGEVVHCTAEGLAILKRDDKK